MLVGVFGDAHLNKNMRSLQYLWDTTAMKSFLTMYDQFDELGVELVVGLGDLFDVPRLEAKHLNVVLPILNDMNSRSYPTYILLGNHEIYDEENNILEYLSIYDNIHPITSSCIIEDMCFIPYSEDPTHIDMKDKIVFTHHDIYGSSLASGKTQAFFGISPAVFQDAKLVMNGHVHLKSKVAPNILNAGSILISQQGELRLGEYPSYYLLDTHTADYKSIDNKHSMIYLTIDESESARVVDTGYDQMHCVLKVEFDGELPSTFLNAAHTSWRRKIHSIESDTVEVVHHQNFDMKNYVTDYIKKDDNVSDDNKESYIKLGLELLS